MIHNLHGSRACVSLGRTSARPYSYQTYMWSIPFMVPGHVSHQVKTAARTYSYKTYKWYTPCMVSGHVSHQVLFMIFTQQHQSKLVYRIYTVVCNFLMLNITLQKTAPPCEVPESQFYTTENYTVVCSFLIFNTRLQTKPTSPYVVAWYSILLCSKCCTT